MIKHSEIGVRAALRAAVFCLAAGLATMAGCDGTPIATGGSTPVALEGDLALGSTGAAVATWHEYLHDYGYFPNDALQARFPAWRPLVAGAPARPDVFDARTESATRAFQHNFGLPETGIVDEATRALANRQRCGVPDGIAPLDRSDKWDLTNSGVWGKNALTWKLISNDGDVTDPHLKQDIAAVLATWAQESAYSFSEAASASSADIQIGFANLGASGPLGSTAPISGGGDVTMNSAIAWSDVTPVPSGHTDIRSLLLHELGHALGLIHSSFPPAVMGPFFFQDQAPRLALTVDDVTAIHAMNIEWQQFDNFNDLELAFNTHAFGSSLWVLGGSAVGGGRQIWELVNTSTWVLHPGGAVHIDVNAVDHNVPWLVNDAGNIFRYNSTVDGWDLVPGCATDIAVGQDDSVWIVGCANTTGGKIIRKLTASLPCSANCWTTVPGGATRISVGFQKPAWSMAPGVMVPWIVNSSHQIFRRSSAALTGATWETLPGSANDIAAANGEAWIIGTTAVGGGFNIQVWDEQGADTGGQPPPAMQRKWVTVPGGAVNITMGSGRPMVVNNGGAAFWTL